MKVTVVGAGIVGIATACYLRRDGHEVVVVTADPVGEYCSFGNAGMLNNAGCVPQAVPGILAKVPGYLTDPLGPLTVRWWYLPRAMPWMLRFVASATRKRVTRGSEALYALIKPTVECYEDLARHAGCADLVRRSGYLVAYEAERNYRKDEFVWRLRRERGVETEVLDAAGIRSLVPQLAPNYVRGVHILNQGFVANPERLTKALAAQFERDGGKVISRKVLGIEAGEGGARTLQTDGGSLPVDNLVVCAGVHSGEISAMLDEPVPIEAERGYHVTYTDPGLELPLPVHVSDAKVFVTPMEMGVRVAGQAEFAGIYTPPNYQRADVLETHMRRMFPQVHAADKTRWMGRRPSMPDSLPVLGRSRKHANVYYAFGHGHLGLCGGAPSGRLIADLVSGRTPAIDLTPFRIDRF